MLIDMEVLLLVFLWTFEQYSSSCIYNAGEVDWGSKFKGEKAILLFFRLPFIIMIEAAWLLFEERRRKFSSFRIFMILIFRLGFKHILLRVRNTV